MFGAGIQATCKTNVWSGRDNTPLPYNRVSQFWNKTTTNTVFLPMAQRHVHGLREFLVEEILLYTEEASMTLAKFNGSKAIKTVKTFDNAHVHVQV